MTLGAVDVTEIHGAYPVSLMLFLFGSGPFAA